MPSFLRSFLQHNFGRIDPHYFLTRNKSTQTNPSLSREFARTPSQTLSGISSAFSRSCFLRNCRLRHAIRWSYCNGYHELSITSNQINSFQCFSTHPKESQPLPPRKLSNPHGVVTHSPPPIGSFRFNSTKRHSKDS